MGEKEKPRLWTGLLCTTDNRTSGWQADHGSMDEVVGCTCHDKRTEMAGNDDTPKRIKNQRWENLAKSGERTGNVAHNEEYTTTFTYYPENHQIEIDRTYSGVNADVACVRKIEIAEKHHAPKLHFIMDRYSVELFINDGEQTASVVIPTPLEANEIIFTSDEAATVNIEKYEITFN